MISFPNYAGQTQETCIFSTPCPMNVMPVFLLWVISHSSTHTCTRTVMVQTGLSVLGVGLLFTELKVSSKQGALANVSAPWTTVPSEGKRGVEIIHWDKLNTHGACYHPEDRHSSCVPLTSRHSGQGSRSIKTDLGLSPVFLLSNVDHEQGTEFLQAGFASL